MVQYTLILLLDLSKAFDCIWHNGIKYKINSITIYEYLKAIIFSYIDERSFHTSIHNTTLTIRKIEAGVPQGRILGPLFNLYTYDVPVSDTYLLMFGDDTVTQQKNQT